MATPTNSVYTRHRGPYRLMAVRPFATRPGFIRSEWLTGDLAADEVMSEALAILSDPRDRIAAIDVWSVREAQFVMSYTRADYERRAREQRGQVKSW